MTLNAAADNFDGDFSRMVLTFKRAISKLQYELGIEVSETTPLYTYRLTLPAQIDLLARGEAMASEWEMYGDDILSPTEKDFLLSFYELASAIVGPSFE